MAVDQMKSRGFVGPDEGRIGRAFQQAPMVMVVFDKDAHVRSINDAAKALVGDRSVDSSVLPGQLFHCVNAGVGDGCGTTPACKSCSIRSAINTAFQEQLEITRLEASLNIYDNGEPTKRYYLLSTTIINQDGEMELLLSLLDITEMKRSEIHLQQVNKKLNILGSFTRHDVLNQVTAAQGYLELLEMVSNLDEKQRDYLEKALRSVVNISEYMKFNRTYQELGSRAPTWQDVVQSVMDAHSHWTNVRIEIDPSLVGLNLYADPLINKVFYNLMDNSIRHGGDINRITVSLEKGEDSNSIIWEDDGVGIPDDMKERIFLQGVGKNTGLGLFLVREILAITNITITEEGMLGEGARFRIRVPRFDCRWV